MIVTVAFYALLPKRRTPARHTIAANFRFGTVDWCMTATTTQDGNLGVRRVVDQGIGTCCNLCMMLLSDEALDTNRTTRLAA